MVPGEGLLFGVLVALAVGLAGGAVATGAGAPSVASDRADYAPGDTVALSGVGWQPGETVHIVVDDAAGDPWSHQVDVAAAADGTVSDSFPLPSVTGTFTVTATAPSGTASASFTATGPPAAPPPTPPAPTPPPPTPTVAADKATYTPGGTVALTGASWTAGSTVHVVVDDDKGDPWSHTADLVAAADGTIADSFSLPTSFSGAFTVTATGALGQSATASFSDALAPQPTVSTDRPSYAPGDTVTLAGASWAVGSTVHVAVDDDKGEPWSYTADVVAGVDGAIGASFALPTSFAGVFTVTATGTLGETATATFSDAFSGQRVGYLVTFVSGTSTASEQSVLSAAGATVDASIAPLHMYSVTFPSETAAVGAASLSGSSSVVRVETDHSRDVAAVPNDPDYAQQWSLPTIGWDQVFGSPVAGSATVAILDTGVDASHADLAGQVVPGTSVLGGGNGESDPNGHGTAMAGIVAAATDNGTGIVGVGYAGVKVMPVTVLGADGTGQDSDIIQGLVWAADHGADVALMAFSNPGYSASLQAAIDYAWSKGVVLVAATGNDGSATVNYPAGDRGVVGVAATDSTDAVWSLSNTGPDVFIAAPGVGIETTTAGGGYGSVSGTSAASAEVAGAAALIHAATGAANGVVVNRLAANADPVGSSSTTGNGRLNLARAFAATSTESTQPAGAAPNGSGGPFVGPYVIANKNLVITFAGTGGGSVAITANPNTPVPSPNPCTASCTVALDNNATGTLTATPNATSNFVGWSGSWVSPGTTTCSGTTNPCNYSIGNKAQAITVTFNTNTAPVVDLNGAGAGIDNASSFTEDGGPVTLVPAATVSDDGSNLASATVTLTTRPDGNATESLAAATTGTSITASYTPSTGVLSLTGSDTKAHYQQVIRTVTYNNTSQSPTTTNRSVTFVVNDGSLSSATATDTVSVTAVNDAPVLNAAGSPTFTAINEDATNPAGDSVAALITSGGGGYITDVDSGALQGIAVTAVDNTKGAWEYSTNSGVSWTAIAPVSASSALLLGSSASNKIRFVPSANFNGSATITLRAWDQTSGSNGAKVDTTTSGGTTAFSTATDSASITVNAVNDAPQGGDNTVTTNEDTDYTFAVADFPFADPNDSPANGFDAVKITALPGAGTLELIGGTLSAGDFVSKTDIIAGKLVFHPAANANGSPYTTFTFQVQDDGGTLNGGVDLDQSPNTLTINVLSVNDPPSADDGSKTLDEDDPPVAIDLRPLVDDVETLDANLTYTIVAGPGKGVLTADATNGVFNYDSNDNANGADSFTYKVTDRGDPDNCVGSPPACAAAKTSATKTISITINPVNDAPVLNTSGSPKLNDIDAGDTSNAGTSISDLIASGGAGYVTDVDAGPQQGIAVTAADTTQGAWQYTTNGGTTWNPLGVVSAASARLLAADGANTRIRFVPGSPGFYGTVDPAVTFRAWDTTSGANGGSADTSVNGGTTAFSTATDTASIAVKPGSLTATGIFTDVDDKPFGSFDVLFGKGSTSSTLKLKNTNPGTFKARLTIENTTGTPINSDPGGNTATVILTVPGMPTSCGLGSFNCATGPTPSGLANPAFILKGANPVKAHPDDKTDDMKVEVRYLDLAGYTANGNSCTDKPTTPWSSAIPTGAAAKCIKIFGFAIPDKHLARIDVHMEFRPKDTDGWPTSPDSKVFFRAGFGFAETTIVTFPSVPTVRTSALSFGIVGAGQKLTAVGGFVFDQLGNPLSGFKVRLFNSSPVQGTACGPFPSGAVAEDTTQADGFWFIWRTGNDQANTSAPLLPSGVQYVVVACDAGGTEKGRVTLSNKLANKEFAEADLRVGP